MRIAEVSHVATLYPHVPAEAVEHLLWALHRTRPLAETGDTAAALTQLRTDLAGYPGPLTDLAPLGVTHLIHGLEQGRHAFAGALGAQGLLAAERDPVRYIIIGPLLDARLWARQRGIGQNTIIAVRNATDVYKLRGLPATGVAIVRLADRRADPTVEDAISTLLQHGAITLTARWVPGNRAEPGEPRLDLRAPAPGA